MPERTITYFGDTVRVYCDANCKKAWGHNGGRPRIEFDPDEPDDYAYLADHEVGEAPDDPGTYEGIGDDGAKPTAYGDDPANHYLNRWCIRECERSGMMGGRYGDHPAPDFSRRVYNMPSRHPEADG